MPLQAVALKKYRCGRPPVSKISDNEHASASLGNSKVLSVKHSVGEPVPEFDQPSEYGTKIPSSIGRQDAGDVLPHHPAGPESLSQPKIFEGQVTTVVCQSASESRDAERLARCSSDQKVDWVILARLDRGEVAMARNLWIMMCEDRTGKLLDLGKEGRPPAERVPSDGCGFDA
jgi:hypothetical protein